MQTYDYIVLFGYFVVMIGIGIWCSFGNKEQEDYFMGGRGFGKLLQTFAAFGAGTGAHDPITTSRTVWTSGMSGIWSTFMWLFVTPFYWIFGVWYRRMRHLTLGDWFVERYQSKHLGAVYTLFAFLFCILYLSAMFAAISKVAEPLMGDAAITALVQTFSLDGPESIKFVLLPTIAVVVLIYGALGGLTAAYYTDLLQGLCIIFLSVILIPAGLWQLGEVHRPDEDTSLMAGFEIMHEQLPESYFSMFSGPSAGEFPLHYIVSLSLLALLGIVVQPHFIATGGGSAKSELDARVGLVSGNFLKRFCTIGWALTGLIVLALLAGDVKANADPDLAWGRATLRILEPLNLGLVGLMLACLLAALMSSADCYMIITSGLLIRNVYAAYFNPDASEKTYVMLGRLAGIIVIAGAMFFAMFYYDVFKQYTAALEVLIPFAAPFWLGMYWRGANRFGTWATVAISSLLFFILPIVIPLVMPDLNTNQQYAVFNNVQREIITRPATPSDIERYNSWEAARAEIAQLDDPVAQTEALAELGPQPPEPSEGQLVDERTFGGVPIYWSKVVEQKNTTSTFKELRRTTTDSGKETIVQRKVGTFEGQGSFNLDYLLYDLLGVDLQEQSKAMLATLRLPPRLIIPFLIMIVVSLLTPRDSRELLDRYYSKMKTPVDPDPETDRAKLAQAYANRAEQERQKLLPGTSFEFNKPSVADVGGFVLCWLICILFVGIAVAVSQIGS
jgi:solute:Na+ symporter, SSS family